MNKIVSIMNGSSFITEETKIKLKQLKPKLYKLKSQSLNSNLKILLNKMIVAFATKIKVYSIESMDIKEIKKVFINFTENINNIKQSKFIDDLKEMTFTYSIQLILNHNTITLHFIFPTKKLDGYISIIIHVINTFCLIFPVNYDQLQIYICLDANQRKIILPTKLTQSFDVASQKKKIDYLKKKSLAFSVSGVTNKFKNEIIITRMEECVKLIFHEMTHYAQLDHVLRSLNNNFGMNFSIDNNYLNHSEAYAEFMSVILTSAYQSIHLISESSIEQVSQNDIYYLFSQLILFEKEYSYYLSANLLKFYGYNDETFKDFFNGTGVKCNCPIAAWEYIILRSELLLNVDAVADIVAITNWKITDKDVDRISKLLTINNQLINKIGYYMKYTEPIQNFSYMLIDFDWTKI